jgi:catechol 2,3-dioxygenase-like lactoylglutathione lyase family enzyme
MFSSPQVNIYTRDIERSLRFYRSLGFTETFRTPPDGRPDHVELRLDGFTVGIARVEAAVRDHGLDLDLAQPGRGMEVVVWTDDADRAFADLTAAGASSLSAPHDWLADLRVAWVADPDDNPVELVARRG